MSQCNQCGHEWSPRVVDPASCPSCKRYDWAEEKKGVSNGTVQASAVRVRQGDVPVEAGRAQGDPVASGEPSLPPAKAVPVPGGAAVARGARSQGVRGVHDPKTCRVYKCGQCSAKEKL